MTRSANLPDDEERRRLATVRLGLGIAACIGILVLAILWSEVPATIAPCTEDPAEPYSIAHCVQGPPLTAAILELVISLLAIAGVAVLATRMAPGFKVVVGSTAAALAALAGLMSRHGVDAQIFDIGYLPSPNAAAIVGGAFFAYGALVVWVTERWWPGKSLQRARER